MESWLVAAAAESSWTLTGMLLSAIAALSGAVVYLYRENRSLQKQWRDDIQAYAKELLELNKQTTSAVNGLEELYERISRGGARR